MSADNGPPAKAKQGLSMSQQKDSTPPKDPRELAKDLKATVGRMRAANPESADVKGICDQAQDASTTIEELAARNATLGTELAACKSGLKDEQAGLDRKRLGNRQELKNDLKRVGAMAVFAAAAWWWPNFWTGALSAVAGMGYVLALVAVISLRSDRTYDVNGERLGHSWPGTKTYWLMPSRVAAVFVVAGIFFAVWSGFGALYASCPPVADMPCAPEHPFVRSFLTLATFDGPPAEMADSLARLVVLELACAVFLTLGIFGLLINRLSEFD